MIHGQNGSLLTVEGLSFGFLPGEKVLDGLSFSLFPGEILGLAGENGAGKTTLARILAGQLPVPDGKIIPSGAGKKVSLVPQHPEFAPEFTLRENLILGREGCGLLSLMDRKEIDLRLNRAAALLGYGFAWDTRAGELTSAGIQKAALTGALLEEPDILILDEPTASLPPPEARSMLAAITSLSREKGIGVILISHRLEEMMSCCSSILVLEDGRIKAQVPKSGFNFQTLSGMMVGTPQSEKQQVPEKNMAGRPLLEVTDLRTASSSRGALRDISFSLQPGEILGIAGLREEGMETLEDCLSGLRPWASGKVTLNGIPMEPGNPRLFRRAGLGCVPADRMGRGSVPEASILENLMAHKTGSLSRGGVLTREKTLPFFRRLQEMFDFQGRPEQRLAELSGGNIQRLILSRELEIQPAVLLLSEPSRGLDLASRRNLHDLLRDLRRQGRGILLLSGDLGELLDLSDRLGVIYRGRLTDLKTAQDWTAGDLDRHILGGS